MTLTIKGYGYNIVAGNSALATIHHGFTFSNENLPF
jgi:hypothetical protein